MYRINVILADRDSEYLDKVQDFCNCTFAAFIKVMTFTKGKLLKQFLSDDKQKTDILVIHPDLLTEMGRDEELLSSVRLVLLLADGSMQEEPKEYPLIEKFQPGDRLIKDILGIYAEYNSNVSKLISGNNASRLVAVYSAAGGTGKTSIALGLAARLSLLGRKVFCLSLESVNSMTPALTCTGNDAMTHVLLSLNENAASLTMSVQIHKTTDHRFRLDFLEPPDCFLELGELDREDVRDLLVHLVKMGAYDEIIVDMDSHLDEKTVCILECADSIVLVEAPEYTSRIKTDIFLEEINRIGLSDRLGLTEKLIQVMNKSQGEPEPMRTRPELPLAHHIPFREGLWQQRGSQVCFDEAGLFINSLSGLAKQIVRGQGDCHCSI